MKLLQFDTAWINPEQVCSVEPYGKPFGTAPDDPHRSLITLANGRQIATTEEPDSAARLISRELQREELQISGRDQVEITIHERSTDHA